MEKITIRLEEKDGTARIKEPVSLGIPLPKNSVKAAHQLSIRDGHEPVSVQFEPLAHWPDGSLRWVHASFMVSLEPNQLKNLELTQPKEPNGTTSREPVTEQTPNGWVVRTSTGSLALTPNRLNWQLIQENGTNIQSTVTLSDEAGLPCIATADSNWELTSKGSVFVVSKLKGKWLKQNNEPLAQFECELKIFLETGLIQVELTTHNPKRARHPGGLWDLGDSGSVYFRELAVATMIPINSVAKVTPQAIHKELETVQLADFNLYQDSSGGENWQSQNHLDRNGKLTTQFKGYRLFSPNNQVHEGRRADPLVSIGYNGGTLDVAVPDFWQNFPTSLRKKENILTVGLFPKDAKNAYELQGGERKTLRCIMGSGPTSIAATAYAPLVPLLAPECYEQADAFPWFTANKQPDALDQLIDEGVSGNSNFFAKREVIDEFGWRNFGDIFADHETLYQDATEPAFISHYNNQYDAIYGFARQYALTGDRRWFRLMDDLAQHVVDIDIYHTDEDRTEYNNGLFWHTDHYLDAHTASHRTFTRHNDTSSTPGQTGGGPAPEHCYTTGLLYHYYITGKPASRDAVLQLAHWIRGSHEQHGGLLAQFLAVKKHDLPKLKALLRGERPSPHQYPFTRGTGNYLNALLDASLLEPHEDWLGHAGGVIRKTIHPADNIEQRNLLEVETGWSYLILMASIARYIYLKREAGSTDAQYSYARDAFLHYADWILANERPFLSDPRQLEFPNDTWVAQDIRKAMLMFQAAELDPARIDAFQNRGRQWLAELCETLAGGKQKHYARILIILMQNYGPQQVNSHKGSAQLTGGPKTANHDSPPRLTWGTLAARIVGRLACGILAFRPTKEKAWLNARLDRP